MSQIMPTVTVCGVVLAGGQSTRMGENKAFLKRAGQSMLLYTCQQLVNAGVTSLVINGCASVYDDDMITEIAKQLLIPVCRISDLMDDCGPVGGIYSVLSYGIDTERVLFVPVDLPWLSAKALTLLITAGCEHRCAAHFEQHPLPLFVCSSDDIVRLIKQQIYSEKLSVKHFLAQLTVKTLDDENKAMYNANTLAEWKYALSHIKK